MVVATARQRLEKCRNLGNVPLEIDIKGGGEHYQGEENESVTLSSSPSPPRGSREASSTRVARARQVMQRKNEKLRWDLENGWPETTPNSKQWLATVEGQEQQQSQFRNGKRTWQQEDPGAVALASPAFRTKEFNPSGNNNNDVALFGSPLQGTTTKTPPANIYNNIGTSGIVYSPPLLLRNSSNSSSGHFPPADADQPFASKTAGAVREKVDKTVLALLFKPEDNQLWDSFEEPNGIKEATTINNYHNKDTGFVKVNDYSGSVSAAPPLTVTNGSRRRGTGPVDLDETIEDCDSDEEKFTPGWISERFLR